MLKYILKRVLLMIPQLIVLSMLVFGLSKFMPGDPLLREMMNDPNITIEMINKQKDELGLNDPLPEQYLRWADNALHGDFGNSYQYKLPVSTIVGRNLMNTFFLGMVTLVLTYAIAIPLGILAGKYAGTWIDKLITGYNYVTLAIPTFIFALFMLFIFGYKLRWFPTSGSVDINAASDFFSQLATRMKYTFLPALTFALLSTTGIVQYLRNEIIDTKVKDFVKTARAKGASEKNLYRKHIFRNSLLPVAAFSGASITGILGGNIFIERIFGYQGIGQLFITSLNLRDSTVVIALVLLSGVLTLIGTLLSDIIMALVDPRIRIE